MYHYSGANRHKYAAAGRLTRASLGICLVGACVGGVAVPCSGLTVSGVRPVGLMLLILAIMATVYGTVRPMPMVACISTGLAVLLVSSMLAFTIAAAGLALQTPLIDAQLASLDEWLGFDTLAMTKMIARMRFVPDVLGFVYVVSSIMPVFLLPLLAWFRRYDRAAELAFVFATTVILCATISIITPAIGAFEYFGIAANVTERLPSNAGIYHLRHFHALRAGSHYIDWSDPTGLVTFPSFHTCLALIPAQVARGVRWMFWPLILLAGTTLLATVPIGGHYGVDLLSGALVMLIAIVLARAISRRSQSLISALS